MGQGNKARIISCAKDANTDAHATRYSRSQISSTQPVFIVSKILVCTVKQSCNFFLYVRYDSVTFVTSLPHPSFAS